MLISDQFLFSFVLFFFFGGGVIGWLYLFFVFWVRGYINIPLNTFTLLKFSLIFLFFKNNSTVSSLDLSSNGLGSAGLFYVLEMLQSNKIISDIVSKVLRGYV